MLCALLAGNTPTYTTAAGGITVCATNASGNIVFPGNWCGATNAAATPTGADSVQPLLELSGEGVRLGPQAVAS